jgi:nucleoid-associated protein YgaU
MTFDLLVHIGMAGILAVALTAAVWAIDLTQPNAVVPQETASPSPLAAQASAPVAATADPSPTTAASITHTVRAGDTLRELAGRFLGDEERWPEIRAANPDVVLDPDNLPIGIELRIPTP